MKTEGRNAVTELLKTDVSIEKILIQNGLREPEAKRLVEEIKKTKIKFQFADKNVLDKESSSGKHQGFIAYTTDFKYSELDEIAFSSDFLVLLDGVEDPHNLGSIIRVCECAGVGGLVIPERRSASVTDTVMRISEGAVNHVKIAKVTNLNSAIDYLKGQGFWITGAELGGENIYKADLTGKIALVIGSEGQGIKRLTKEKCDRIVTIPMKGKVNSLNASVACGVVVFEVVRQRDGR